MSYQATSDSTSSCNNNNVKETDCKINSGNNEEIHSSSSPCSSPSSSSSSSLTFPDEASELNSNGNQKYNKEDKVDGDENNSESSTNDIIEEPKEIYLECEWVFYYDEGVPKGSSCDDYQSHIKNLGSFNSVQGFWRYWNNIVDVSLFPIGANLRLFKAGIAPTWEDPANENGGKFSLMCTKEQSSNIVMRAILTLIGEQLEYGHDVCGFVLAVRPNRHIVSVWNKSSDNQEIIEKTSTELSSFIQGRIFKYTSHKQAATMSPMTNTNAPPSPLPPSPQLTNFKSIQQSPKLLREYSAQTLNYSNSNASSSSYHTTANGSNTTNSNNKPKKEAFAHKKSISTSSLVTSAMHSSSPCPPQSPYHQFKIPMEKKKSYNNNASSSLPPLPNPLSSSSSTSDLLPIPLSLPLEPTPSSSSQPVVSSSLPPIPFLPTTNESSSSCSLSSNPSRHYKSHSNVEESLPISSVGIEYKSNMLTSVSSPSLATIASQSISPILSSTTKEDINDINNSLLDTTITLTINKEKERVEKRKNNKINNNKILEKEQEENHEKKEEVKLKNNNNNNNVGGNNNKENSLDELLQKQTTPPPTQISSPSPSSPQSPITTCIDNNENENENTTTSTTTNNNNNQYSPKQQRSPQLSKPNPTTPKHRKGGVNRPNNKKSHNNKQANHRFNFVSYCKENYVMLTLLLSAMVPILILLIHTI